jgi:hypothetical protein
VDADEVSGRRIVKLGDGWRKVDARDLFASDPEVRSLVHP